MSVIGECDWEWIKNCNKFVISNLSIFHVLFYIDNEAIRST